jgi:hypothetical protein
MLSRHGLPIESLERNARTKASEEIATSMKYYVPGAKEELTVDTERTVLHLLQKQVVSYLQAGAVCIRYPIPDLRQIFPLKWDRENWL